MKQRLEPEQMWSIAASTVYGGLTGFAVGVVHQIHSALSTEIPDNVYMHVVGALLVEAIGGAILFAAAAWLRNWLKRRS
ncbi:hypothetical protein ACD578_27710 (plasmid) [Microvirga sp. RSM25]|uniref:hypothetical protein n=1 Tax=Microvirga sp. RSM25 TaxID=3273802 RepID=UPI00385113B7